MRPLLVAIVLVAACSNDLPHGSNVLPFDAVVWKSDRGLAFESGAPTPRQQMLEDLTTKHLSGLTRNDVLVLLGEPATKMDPDTDGPTLSYPTGFERGSAFAIDSEWLIIFFDANGKYRRYEIRND